MHMQQDGVILLHGIFRTRFSMRRLEKALQRDGFATLNLTYPSTRMPLEQLVEWLHPRVLAFAGGKAALHWVGHSMGGLLIRAYMQAHRPANLGRVVMIGTPNAGSEVADFVQHWWLYKKLYGPAGQQLVTSPQAVAHLFGPVDYELGIIAGSRSLDPLGSYIIGKPSDGKVSIESSKLQGMKDHAVIACDHTFMPANAKVMAQVRHFLQHGQFRG